MQTYGLPCGCEIAIWENVGSNTAEMKWCNLHENALGLLTAGKMFLEDFERPIGTIGLRVRAKTADLMRDAVSKSEKK